MGDTIAEGAMPRPNDGKVADDGLFILNDWGAIESLNGTFWAFNPDGTKRFSRSFKANLFKYGLSTDGRFAACQTANAPHDDGGSLFIFELIAGSRSPPWKP